MEKLAVFFRADGGNHIGLGHLVRCIALAQMIESHFNINFVCRSIPEKIANDIDQLQFKLIRIKEEEEFLALLKPVDIVVLDSYELDSSYQKKVKAKGCKLVYIDDLNQQSFLADLIINHTPNVNGVDYHAQLYTQYALGLSYVLLRPIFLKAAKEPKIKLPIKTAFVCFGGSDSKNLTQLVVDVLKKDKRFEHILIVTGAAYAHLNELEQAIKNDSRCKLSHAITSEEICELMQKAQLAIVPASGILQEAIAVGCRIISGTYVDNQKNIFEKYNALGAFESAEDFSRDHLINAIDRSFENEDLPIKTYIDGNSCVRLLNAFEQLVKQDELVLRQANEQDVQKTFEWATEPKIRAFSFNTAPIVYAEHVNWFTQKINHKDCCYLMASIKGHSIGSIRFDIKNNSALISYLLDPAYHHQGLGILLLKKGVEKLIEINNEIKEVIGYVLPQNIASIKAFERLGYLQLMEAESFKFEKKIGS